MILTAFLCLAVNWSDPGIALASPPSHPNRNNGTQSAGKMMALVVRDRQVTLREATNFAQTLLQARKLVDEFYIRPSCGLVSLKAGILSLFRQSNTEIPEDVRKRLQNMDDLRGIELARLLEDIRLRIGDREEFAGHQPLELCLSSMAQSLDPYSDYYPPQVWEEMQAEANGGFVGIGVRLREQPGTKNTIVETTILGSPAFQAGIHARDRIIEVDGVDTHSIGMEETAKLLSGPEGQRVRIGIQRNGSDESENIFAVRRKVRVESVVGRCRNPDFSWDYWIDEKAGLVYIRITSFAEETAEDLIKVLGEHTKQGMKGLVLDLRFNPGGLLDSAVQVADQFLSSGLIVSIKDRQGEEIRKNAHAETTLPKVPLVVLINRQSASGSEIVSAALADHQRATLVGERTFGKGSIQNLHPIERDSSVLKLTTATFHRPNGQNLHRFPDSTVEDVWGVSPEAEQLIPLTDEQTDALRVDIGRCEIIERPDQPPVFHPYNDAALEKGTHLLRDLAAKEE